jgi:hypothetical protein
MNLLICVRNDGYEASLEPRKLYEKLTDPQADSLGMVRVIDESGQDYLYSAQLFEPIEIPTQLEGRLFRRAA